jgi:FAD synthase
LEFIRSEQRFPSLDALKEQISADCEIARSRLS